MTLQEAAEAAYALGRRQEESGRWFHPEYDRADDPAFDSPLEVCTYEKAYFLNGAWRRGQP